MMPVRAGASISRRSSLREFGLPTELALPLQPNACGFASPHAEGVSLEKTVRGQSAVSGYRGRRRQLVYSGGRDTGERDVGARPFFGPATRFWLRRSEQRR